MKTTFEFDSQLELNLISNKKLFNLIHHATKGTIISAAET